MHPIICQIGPITIYSYGVMFALACLICLYLLLKEAKKEGIDLNLIYDLFFWIIICAILGARLLYILTNLKFFLSNPSEIFKLHHGGLSWFGGLAFGFLAVVIITKNRHIAFLRIADIFAPFLALGQAIGRIGCFLNGCCYGKPTQSIFGIHFPGFLKPLHPTQLYSFLSLFLIFIVLILYKRKAKPAQGKVFFLYLMLCGLERFISEFFRGDTIITPVFNLTLFQVFSLTLILSAGFLYYILRKR
ncbi:MAG: prolipoprotein diacylglyceryl transferase [Candidatus Omnitrophota bacterium]